MKKIISLILSAMMLFSLTTAVFASEADNSDMSTEETYTFDELTDISQKNIVSIEITQNKGERKPITISSPILIYRMVKNIEDLVLKKEVSSGGGAGGWTYNIKFLLDDGTTVAYTFSTGIKIDGIDYRPTDETRAREKLVKYYNFLKEITCSQWAAENILECIELGFMNEIEISELAYTDPITREKFCEIIYDMLMKTIDTGFAVPSALYFEDTYNSKVSTLYYADIINGKADRIFAPDDFLTREEAATILVRTAQFMGIGMPQSAYDGKVYDDEKDISEWAFPSVHYCRKLEMMTGTGEAEFSPKAEYTVEQAIATVMRLYKKSGKKIRYNITITDFDNNILISNDDIVYSESYHYNPQGPGAAVLGRTLEIEITDEAKERFFAATKDIERYPILANCLIVISNGNKLNNPVIYANLERNEIKISGSGVVSVGVYNPELNNGENSDYMVKLVDKDNNYLITEEDILSCELKTLPSPGAPADNVIPKMYAEIKLEITPDAMDGLSEAMTKISEYSENEDIVKFVVDGETVSTVRVPVNMEKNVIYIPMVPNDSELINSYVDKINAAIK